MAPATGDEIEQVLSDFRRADEANRATPHRRGLVIDLTPEVADDVFVTADLHGHRRNFATLVRLAALDEHPRRHLVLQEVCHGGPTYPASGGCMSHRLLEEVARLKTAYPERVHFLLSNHEMAEVADIPIVKAGRFLNLSFRLGLIECYGARADEVRRAAMEFILSCPVAVRLGREVLICHSLPDAVDQRGWDPGVLERPWTLADAHEGSDLFRLVWGRDFRPENAEAFARLVDAKVLIHGHEPCPVGYRVPNPRQVILDCAGDLACYAVLPVGTPLEHGDVVHRIERLVV